MYLRRLTAPDDAEDLLALDAILEAAELLLLGPVVEGRHEDDDDDRDEDGRALDPRGVLLLLDRAVFPGIVLWRFVEGEPQRDDRRQLQDDERDVLQGLPDQFEKGLGRLRRDHVRPEHVLAPRQIVGQALETCKRTGKERRGETDPMLHIQNSNKKLESNSALIKAPIYISPSIVECKHCGFPRIKCKADFSTRSPSMPFSSFLFQRHVRNTSEIQKSGKMSAVLRAREPKKQQWVRMAVCLSFWLAVNNHEFEKMKVTYGTMANRFPTVDRVWCWLTLALLFARALVGPLFVQIISRPRFGRGKKPFPSFP